MDEVTDDDAAREKVNGEALECNFPIYVCEAVCVRV